MIKVILVGFGEAGYGWYQIILRHGGLTAAIVDVDIRMKAKLNELNDAAPPFYISLEEAIEAEKPRFIINVTPPTLHSAINEVAFRHRLPVLCEKPISYSYAESKWITEMALHSHVPFMIAENYRNLARIRQMREWIVSGKIGRLLALNIDFNRYKLDPRSYKVRLLNDITVHHLDLLRFLTQSEGKAIWADLSPEGQIYLLIEMDRKVIATYNASIRHNVKEAPWCGNWRIEGTKGTLLLHDGILSFHSEGVEMERMENFNHIRQPGCLEQFVAYLNGGQEPETLALSYLKTEALVYYAEQSHLTNKWMDIV